MNSQGVFDGYRVAITGGTRGIGKAIALRFAGEGAAVAICGRSEAALEAMAAPLRAQSNACHLQCCDVAAEGAVEAFIETTATVFGGLDVLVNNASGVVTSSDDDPWTVNFRVDLRAAVMATCAAEKYLSARPGCIVNIASIAALRSTPRTPSYGALKAAVIHFTRTSAAELASQGIRVNAVLPGSIEYPGGTWARRKIENPELYSQSLQQIRLGRMGSPEEVAAVVRFLACADASWITGVALPVDGGQTL